MDAQATDMMAEIGSAARAAAAELSFASAERKHAALVGAAIAWGIEHHSHYTLFVVPWICLIIGWTYLVNDDCVVIIEFSPAPGIVIQEKGVLVDNGHELRTITVTPATTMVTATHLRM